MVALIQISMHSNSIGRIQSLNLGRASEDHLYTSKPLAGQNKLRLHHEVEVCILLISAPFEWQAIKPRTETVKRNETAKRNEAGSYTQDSADCAPKILRTRLRPLAAALDLTVASLKLCICCT